MKRRVQVGAGMVPPLRLRRYDPADWPNGCHPACAFVEAHRAWRDEHGPDGRHFDISSWPRVPFHPERI